MNSIITANGMVLSAMPVGEYDKRVVLLTKELGKISAFARGARRQNSPLLACARPFTFGSFSLYPGRNSYTLQSVEAAEYFEELGMDIEAVTYGFYFLEIADYYTREGVDESQMLNLLYVTVKALLNPRLDNLLVKTIYELRAMAVNGEYPDFFSCKNCGAPISKGVFSNADLGLYCEECRRLPKDGSNISEAAIYALQFILSEPLNRLYTFMLAKETQKEVMGIIKECGKRFIDKEFHSLSILSGLPKEEQPPIA